MDKKDKVFVQIGTNDGKDEFNEIIKKCCPSKIILVEPNKSLNKDILNNYNGISNVYIENVAITEISKGNVNLCKPSKSINGIKYNSQGFSLLPMDDWGDELIVFKSPSMTFNELCDKYKITNVRFLQIDTEGYDAEIIKAIDFNKINIDILRYERWNFQESCFTRYGDKSKLYGINGMRDVSLLLSSLGYRIIDGLDVLAIKRNLNISVDKQTINNLINEI